MQKCSLERVEKAKLIVGFVGESVVIADSIAKFNTVIDNNIDKLYIEPKTVVSS